MIGQHLSQDITFLIEEADIETLRNTRQLLCRDSFAMIIPDVEMPVRLDLHVAIVRYDDDNKHSRVEVHMPKNKVLFKMLEQDFKDWFGANAAEKYPKGIEVNNNFSRSIISIYRDMHPAAKAAREQLKLVFDLSEPTADSNDAERS